MSTEDDDERPFEIGDRVEIPALVGWMAIKGKVIKILLDGRLVIEGISPGGTLMKLTVPVKSESGRVVRRMKE